MTTFPPLAGEPIANENKALAGFRGIAVAIVVVSHLGNGGFDLVPGIRLNAIGKVGVWLFFGLSAFLLTSHLAALLRARANPWHVDVGRYAINRVFRIYPLYLAVLLAHWGWGDMDFAGVLRHLALVEGMGELWAIPVEFKYYVAIPLVALAAAALGERTTAALLAAAFLAATALSVAWPERPFSNDLDLAFRLPAFAAGSLAALWLASRDARAFSGARYAAGVGLAAVAAAWAYRAVVLDASLAAFAPLVVVALSAVAAAALLGGSIESGVLARAMAARPLAFLGKVSFGVYLWHMFVIRLLMEQAALPKWATAWLAIALTAAVAGLTYAVIEKPGILLGRTIGRRLFTVRES